MEEGKSRIVEEEDGLAEEVEPSDSQPLLRVPKNNLQYRRPLAGR